VERVLLHCEPQSRSSLRYAVPLADAGGAVSRHFGEAPYFGLVTVSTRKGMIEHQEVRSNPHMRLNKGKGIRVSEWLVGLKVDVVLLGEESRGKGPAYVFANAGVEVRSTQKETMSEAIAEQLT
jgi:predicted Fe-Mo cluster-binding NifX family protein